jgi:glyoxylase-like metal-dependent hydrolase (beta-lactamase superfamily II)/ferredoxin
MIAKAIAMAKADEHHEWRVDDRCIGCGASVSVAPELIVWNGDRVRFARQPSSAAEEDAAWRAALVCPTGSIKRYGGGSPPKRYFPEEIAHGVFRCGFNARASYGAHSYFVERSEGNVLIDSPRYVRRLEKFFEEHGGIAAVLLTHRDDVGDADKYAARFASATWIHEADRSAAPFASDIIAGDSPRTIVPGVKSIPIPGHTAGSVAYLVADRFLFTGDSLNWDFETSALSAFKDYCWYSWEHQKRSLERLLQFQFEYVLAGHGGSISMPADEMRNALQSMLLRL